MCSEAAISNLSGNSVKRGRTVAATPAQPATPDDRAWGASFKATYADACAKHDTILRLPGPILDEVVTKLDASAHRYASATSILIWSWALIFLVTYPWQEHVASWRDVHQKAIEQWVSGVIGPLGRPDWLWVIGLVFFPLLWLVVTWSPLRKEPFASILLLRLRPYSGSPLNAWNVVFSFVLVMFLFGVARVAYYLRSKTMSAIFAGEIANTVFDILLSLLFVAVMLLTVTLFGPLVSRIESDVGVQLLARECMQLLLRLDGIADLALLTRTERWNLVDRIIGISRKMSRLHDARRDSATEWATLQMRLASQNVLRFASWLYFPQAGTLVALKEEMIRYTNVLLSGNLDELPRGEVGEMQGLRIVDREIVGWRRALLHTGMVLYFVLPLALAGLLIVVFNWESRVSAPIEMIAGVAYVIWALVGLISFLGYLGPDTRTLVTDVFKAYFGKK